MPYLDGSALAKRYFNELGSDVLATRFGNCERIFTSILTFAEIHSAIARKFKEKEFNSQEFIRIRDAFQDDWFFRISKLGLDHKAMIALPRLVENYSLKAVDPIQLATAVWLRDSLPAGVWGGKAGETVEFGVADKRLARVALECGLQVFNPEVEN